MSVDDSYTKSLLHFDGNNGSTIFTDGSNRVWTTAGGAQLDTSQKKFGTSSILFDESQYNACRTIASDDFSFGTGDFTLECWLRINAFNNFHHLIYNDYFYLSVDWTGVVTFSINVGAKTVVSTAGIISPSTWYHIAGERDGDTMRLFVGGVARGTTSITGITLSPCDSHVYIGSGPVSGRMNGWIDEVRISKGIARFPAGGFTPPSSPYIGLPRRNAIMIL